MTIRYKFIWPSFFLILEYWWNWVRLPADTIIEYALGCEEEGLFYYDGWNATFWWVLNHGWYRANNCLTSERTEAYSEPNDFYYAEHDL